jgi:hypothetical protein
MSYFYHKEKNWRKDLLQTQPKLKEQRIILHQRKRKAFKANPKKYLPEVNGYCAWGIAEKILNFLSILKLLKL